MFSKSDRPQENLQKIMTRYSSLIGNDKLRGRSLLPSHEIWRFFMEGDQQEKGKHLIHYFKNKEIPDCTIQEYAEKHKQGSKNWRTSPFIKFLRKKKCYLTDQNYQQIAVKDLLEMDKAWMLYEHKPGYFKALYIAFQAIFDFSVEFNPSFIKRMHQMSMTDVKGTQYDATEEEDVIGEFRVSNEVSFGLNAENSTEIGFFELLKRKNPFLFFRVPLFIPDVDFNIGSININQNNISVFRQFYQDITQSLTKKNINLETADEKLLETKGIITEASKNLIKKYCDIDPDFRKDFFEKMVLDKKIWTFLGGIATAPSEEKLANYLFGTFASPPFIGYQLSLASQQEISSTQEILNEEMNRYINQFEKSIVFSGESPREKLRAIVTFVQSSHQLHPFVDGNGRTFCILILNHLLMRHGFPPVILDNLARFSAYHTDALVDEVIKGMQNTLDLLEGKKLYNIDSEEILHFLKSKPSLQRWADYFNEIDAIEVEGRHLATKRMSFNQQQ